MAALQCDICGGKLMGRAELRGFFSGLRRRDIDLRLERIEAELHSLESL